MPADPAQPKPLRIQVALFALWLNNTVVPDSRPLPERGGPHPDRLPVFHLCWEPTRRGWTLDIHLLEPGPAGSLQSISLLAVWEYLTITRIQEDTRLDDRLRAALAYALHHDRRPPLAHLARTAEA